MHVRALPEYVSASHVRGLNVFKTVQIHPPFAIYELFLLDSSLPIPS